MGSLLSLVRYIKGVILTEKNIEEAMFNLKEVAEMCIAEQKETANTNMIL